MKICIVTTQLPDLTVAGGIANPTHRLAIGLLQMGNEVGIIVSRTLIPLNAKVRLKYEMLGIKIIEAQEDREMVYPWWLAFQYGIREALDFLDPEVVISQEWQAPLILACGSSNQARVFVTWAHGGTYFESLGSNREFSDKYEAIVANLEYLQMHKSDAVISPSHFLGELYKEIFPNKLKVKVIPLLFPDIPNQAKSSDVRIAFVGALSKRKGFDKFIDIVLKLKKSGASSEVLIFGQEADVDLKKATGDLRDNGIKFRVENHFNSEQIWNELTITNSTLFVPSRLDNSPGVIYEALSAGVKVVVSRNQGGIELEKFAPGAIKLFEEIDDQSLKQFINETTRHSIDIYSINRQTMALWQSELENLVAAKEQNVRKLRENSNILSNDISVVIASRNRANFLAGALESLARQTLIPKEVVVVDDNSSDSDSYQQLCERYGKYLNIRLIKNDKNLGQAESRDIGVKLSTSELVAFLDDDNLFLQDHLKSCFEVMSDSNLDAVATFMAQTFSATPLTLNSTPDQIGIFSGDLFGEINLLENLCCDTHILIRKEVFLSVGGFSGNKIIEKSAQEDWAFGLRLIAHGFAFGSTGKVTIQYRINSDGVQSNSYGSAKWLPVNIAANNLHTDSWLIPLIARSSYSNNGNSVKYKYRKYLKKAFFLILKGDFKNLLNGIKLFLRRY
jgi:GT2 family glycosyltransferase/glycosyltransferase involved in cell wall biosynthesis